MVHPYTPRGRRTALGNSLNQHGEVWGPNDSMDAEFPGYQPVPPSLSFVEYGVPEAQPTNGSDFGILEPSNALYPQYMEQVPGNLDSLGFATTGSDDSAYLSWASSTQGSDSNATLQNDRPLQYQLPHRHLEPSTYSSLLLPMSRIPSDSRVVNNSYLQPTSYHTTFQDQAPMPVQTGGREMERSWDVMERNQLFPRGRKRGLSPSASSSMYDARRTLSRSGASQEERVFQSSFGFDPIINIQEKDRVGPANITNDHEFIIRTWYESFANSDDEDYNRKLNGLAFSIDLPATTVSTWIKLHLSSATSRAARKREAQTRKHHHTISRRPQDVNTAIARHNPHLPPDILAMVQRYVRDRQRVRNPIDGRRKKNEGKYSCTFGCSYRTNRPGDWERHEKIHQTQQLWLCNICRRKHGSNPFLVDRKDKILKHVKSRHEDADRSEVEEASRLEFHAPFDASCPRCDQTFNSWDMRRQHIRQHFENPDDDKSRSKAKRKDRKESGATSDSESDSSSDSSEDNDDSDKDSDHDGDPNAGALGDDVFGDPGADHSGHYGGQGFSGGSSALGHSSYDFGGYHGYGRSLGAYDSPSWHAAGTLKPRQGTIGVETPFEDAKYAAKDLPLGFGLRVRSGNYYSSTPPIIAEIDIYHHNRILHIEHTTRLQPSRIPAKILGFGAHGCVDVVQEHATGRIYARKRFSNSSYSREVAVLVKLNHPHIVRLIDTYFQNASCSLIISPVAQYTLKERMEISSPAIIDPSQIYKWVGCLSSALAYMHSSRIRHADIKPQNVLVRDNDIFISDFGISRIVSEPDSTSSSISPMTLLYAAHEIAEHERHGRKADVFSLGCVFLELLTIAQGKTTKELHKHLAFFTNQSTTHVLPAYYKERTRLISWISSMRQDASAISQRLWDICKCMLQNRVHLRPTASSLLAEVSKALQRDIEPCSRCMAGGESNIASAGDCISNPHKAVVEPNASQDFPKSLFPVLAESDPRPLEGGDHLSAKMAILSPPNDIDKTLTLNGDSEAEESAVTRCTCSYIRKKDRIACLISMADVLTDYKDPREQLPSFYIPNPVYVQTVFHLPPAYTEITRPMIAVSGSCGPVSLFEAQQKALWDECEVSPLQVQAQDGNVGSQPILERLASKPHDQHSLTPSHHPSRSLQRLCHLCGTLFVAPCLQVCRRCDHSCCEKCPFNPNNRCQAQPRKAEPHLLAAIGSHLDPPAYSRHDGTEASSRAAPSALVDASFTDVETDRTVFDMVIAQNQSLGDVPGERFIQDSPSTFDRIHQPSRIYNQSWKYNRPSISAGVEPHTRRTSFENRDSISESPQNKRLKLGSEIHQTPEPITTRPSHRLKLRKSRLCISGRSNQSVRRKIATGMRRTHQPNVDPQDLTARLECVQLQRSRSAGVETSVSIYHPKERSKSDSTDRSEALSRLPTLRQVRGSTTSSTESNPVSRLPIIRTVATPSTAQKSSSQALGEFHKPEIQARKSSDSTRSHDKHFQYYGRHANSWLFNNFSVTDNAKKVFKIFGHGKDGNEET